MSSDRLFTLDQLRPYLNVDEVNTGASYSLAPLGIVTDDIEGLHAVTDEQGRVILRSGIEFFFKIYRGQTQEYGRCIPSLARRKYIEEQLLDVCRNIAFEDAIGCHPYIRICEESRLLGHPLFINRQGLAQHYGLATDLLDLTSNFNVASFFATCAWDSKTQRYLPIEFAMVPGVIYRISSPRLLCLAAEGQLSHVGWQPFPRPEQQRACALTLGPDTDFVTLPGIETVRFRQNAEISHRIWNSFDKGNVLFPNDVASELASRAFGLMEFTRSQISRGWDKLDAWLGVSTASSSRSEIEQRSALSVVEQPTLSWEGLTLERDEGKLKSQLEDVFARVRFRLTAPHLSA